MTMEQLDEVHLNGSYQVLIDESKKIVRLLHENGSALDLDY